MCDVQKMSSTGLAHKSQEVTATLWANQVGKKKERLEYERKQNIDLVK